MAAACAEATGGACCALAADKRKDPIIRSEEAPVSIEPRNVATAGDDGIQAVAAGKRGTCGKEYRAGTGSLKARIV